MNRKQKKIQIIPPFEQITNNWELVHQIQSSLSMFLSHPQTFSPPSKDDSERLGKPGIEQLVTIAKKFLQYVELLRSQSKSIEAIKANAALAQERLEQHEEIIRNYEKKFSQRTKAMVEENRVLKESNDKMKRSFFESEQSLRISLQGAKGENMTLKDELGKLEGQKKHLLQVISNLQNDLTIKEETITQLQRIDQDECDHMTLKYRFDELMQARIQKKMKPNFIAKVQEYPNSSPLQKLGMKDISAFSKILQFLTPPALLILASTNKKIRLFCRTTLCVRSLCRGILAVKNKQINFYHKHINYFERLRDKIPVQVLKTAYFKYHILKESAGQQIRQALNASSLIFQGRFEGEQLYSGLPEFNKELPLKMDFKEATLLSIDPSIVDKFKDGRSQERDQLIKQFEQMYNKIKNTYDLYRADEESSSLFIANILKHFSKVFVLSKSVYFQAENLQNLNSYILSQLNRWDRMEIDKTLQLQDLKAQLQAQKKLKLFFTDKSIKSQQKALLQQNLKLTYQMKYTRLNDLMNITCLQRDQKSKKNEALSKSNQKLTSESKQLRRLYELTRQKYNHVIEELVVVKQTIIKMNII